MYLRARGNGCMHVCARVDVRDAAGVPTASSVADPALVATYAALIKERMVEKLLAAARPPPSDGDSLRARLLTRIAENILVTCSDIRVRFESWRCYTGEMAMVTATIRNVEVGVRSLHGEWV